MLKNPDLGLSLPAVETPRPTRKKKLGTYPFVSVVFSITLALLVLGVFGVMLIFSRELERSVRDNLNIQVYLKGTVTEKQRKQIRTDLASAYFTARKENAIQFISKEEAAEKMIRETGEEFQKFMGNNPLKDAFLVTIAEPYQNQASLEKIKAEIEKMDGVLVAYFVENFIDGVNRNVTKIALILVGIASVLMVVVVLLIHNTLRLALFSQRFLIRSMQLVGATRWFIQKPFLTRAIIHGTLAGLLACALLWANLRFANRHIEEINLLQNNDRILLLMAGLVAGGMLIALLSTWRAVHKYLKLSLDELY